MTFILCFPCYILNGFLHVLEMELNWKENESGELHSMNGLEVSNESTSSPTMQIDISEKPKKTKKRLSVILAQLDELNDYKEKDLNRIQEKIDENVNKLLAQKIKLQEIIEKRQENDSKLNTKQQKKVEGSQKKNVSYKTKSKAVIAENSARKVKNNKSSAEKKVI